MQKNAISESPSADPRTPRLLTPNMYVHDCKCTYIQRIYVCTMPFSEVTILFNQHFIVVGNIVGKSPTGILTGILTLFIYNLKPLKLQNV